MEGVTRYTNGGGLGSGSLKHRGWCSAGRSLEACTPCNTRRKCDGGKLFGRHGVAIKKKPLPHYPQTKGPIGPQTKMQEPRRRPQTGNETTRRFFTVTTGTVVAGLGAVQVTRGVLGRVFCRAARTWCWFSGIS